MHGQGGHDAHRDVGEYDQRQRVHDPKGAEASQRQEREAEGDLADDARRQQPVRIEAAPQQARTEQRAVMPSDEIANSSANPPVPSPSTSMNTNGEPDTNENRQPKLSAPIREWPIAERWVSALP